MSLLHVLLLRQLSLEIFCVEALHVDQYSVRTICIHIAEMTVQAVCKPGTLEVQLKTLIERVIERIVDNTWQILCSAGNASNNIP